MKKFKHIVPFLLALLMTLAIPMSACGGDDDDNKVTDTLQSVVVNADNVKKEYFYGEDFNADGLVVKATVLSAGAETPEERTLSAGEYTVDSSAFISTAYGKYTITVSYTLGGVTQSDYYEVRVIEALQKIEIDKTNVRQTYFIGDKFSADGLAVKAYIKKPGVADLEEKTLTSDEYTVDSSNFNSRREGTYKISVSYTYESATRTATYEVDVIALLDRIELDLTDVKVKFYTDSQQTDQFTTEGLKATAFIWNKETKKLEEKPINYADLKIDSAYKEEIGFYNIKVSYTYENITRSASYEVAHTASSDGLEVTLAEGVADTYTLSSSVTEVEIDVSKIVVKGTERDGTVSSEISDYDVKLYRGNEKIPLNGGTTANVKAGAYNILVTSESERTPGFIRSGFAIIYVNDDLVGFELKGGDFSQDSGLDIISDTWEFTATYASGETKTITAKECVYELDTMTVVKDAPLTITYTDYNAKGGKVTKSVDVTYTINRVYGKIEYTFDHSAIECTEDNIPLDQGDYLKGVNAFLQLAGGTATFRSKTANPKAADCIEVKEKGLNVRFEGVGEIKVGFSSTGSKNESAVALMDVGGNYIPAIYEESNSIRVYDKNPNIYLVTGTIEFVFTFKITKPGVYTIASPAKETGINRGCRVYSISMEDNVDDPSKIICNVDFTDTSKFAPKSIASSTDTVPKPIEDLSGNATGLSVTKSNSPVSPNKIVKVDGVGNVLQLQGTANTERNSVLFNVTEGTIKITVKYSHDAGKYLDLLNASGTVLASSSSKPTTGSGNLTEYTFTLNIDSAQTLYLGSHSGIINIAYIKVEKA